MSAIMTRAMTIPEKHVAYFLNILGIIWKYEQPIFVWDKNRRPRVWAPDLYLIAFGIYVEVCGSSRTIEKISIINNDTVI